MKGFSVFYSFLYLVGTLAAPDENASKVKSQHFCNLADLGQTPFPNAVCKPFTTSNGTVVAVFRQGHIRAKKKYYATVKTITDYSMIDATVWIPNRAGGQQDGFCDNTRDVRPGHANPRMPLVSDCIAIKEWAAANAGYWVISKKDLDKHPWIALSSVGTCAFVVGVIEQNRLEAGIAISSEDVVENMQNAIGNRRVGDKTDGNGVIRDPACGSICAFSELPFDNAVCYEVKLDNGKCKAVFINSKAGKLDFNTTDGAISAGIEVK
ncbi:hypothetical protein LZ30DRAFT_581260, partial [Colletotrichum cereale]